MNSVMSPAQMSILYVNDQLSMMNDQLWIVDRQASGLSLIKINHCFNAWTTWRYEAEWANSRNRRAGFEGRRLERPLSMDGGRMSLFSFQGSESRFSSLSTLSTFSSIVTDLPAMARWWATCGPQAHREEGDATLLDFVVALLLFPSAKLIC